MLKLTRPGISISAQIDERAVVSPDASVAEGCVVASGAVLSSGTVLDADVVVGPNAVFVEPGPLDRAAQVRQGVRIGANATINANVILAAHSVVRPGSVVTRSVPPAAIVEGNPAAIVGYVNTESAAQTLPASSVPERSASESTGVRGVTLHQFPIIADLRGNLTVGEFEKEVPFRPKRYFLVFGVPSQEVRGEHAHHECHQFLICVRGSCTVMADDGAKRIEVELDSPSKGIYLPPMIWGVQYKYSANAMLLVFASHHYDGADYIRNYAEFIELVEPK